MDVRVLIVDDSSTIRRIIRRCIEQARIGVREILEAGDGQEALDVLSTREIEVVLTDINMPRMTGRQLLSEMKKNPRWKSIAVLVITSESGSDTVVDAVQLGAAGYIKKPFTPVELRSRFVPILQSLGHP